MAASRLPLPQPPPPPRRRLRRGLVRSSPPARCHPAPGVSGASRAGSFPVSGCSLTPPPLGPCWPTWPSSLPAHEGGGDDADDDRRAGGRGLPHRGQVAGGDDRVRREAVDLGLVEQQEEGADAADAVSLVPAVEPRRLHALARERRQPGIG